jgi:hypothetical protein
VGRDHRPHAHPAGDDDGGAGGRDAQGEPRGTRRFPLRDRSGSQRVDDGGRHLRARDGAAGAGQQAARRPPRVDRARDRGRRGLDGRELHARGQRGRRQELALLRALRRGARRHDARPRVDRRSRVVSRGRALAPEEPVGRRLVRRRQAVRHRAAARRAGGGGHLLRAPVPAACLAADRADRELVLGRARGDRPNREGPFPRAR